MNKLGQVIIPDRIDLPILFYRRVEFMKIAVYARVSKSDESQDPQNQLNLLRDYAKAVGGLI